MKKLIKAAFFCLVMVSDGWANLIQEIPPEDRIVLERFFQTLMYGSEFGYTLFGSKPVSIAITCSPKELLAESAFLNAEYALLNRGWEVWAHCQNQFPSDRFVLKKSTFKDKELCITIINKPALLQVIHENLEIFQLVFGKYSSEVIVKKICDLKESIFEIKSPHMQSIVGILLGFGKENSLNFQREIEIIQELNHRITPPFFAKIESLSPMAKLFLNNFNPQEHLVKRTNSTTALLEEAKEIIDERDSFEFGKTSFLLEQFLSPRFTCWKKKPETAQLKQSYEQTQSSLRKAYAKGEFLEVTLQQWVGPKDK